MSWDQLLPYVLIRELKGINITREIKTNGRLSQCLMGGCHYALRLLFCCCACLLFAFFLLLFLLFSHCVAFHHCSRAFFSPFSPLIFSSFFLLLFCYFFLVVFFRCPHCLLLLLFNRIVTLLLATLIFYFFFSNFHYFCSMIANLTKALLMLSDAEVQLHLLGKSTKVSRNQHSSVVFFPQTVITQIKTIYHTQSPESILRWYSSSTVVQSLVRQSYSGSRHKVQWKYVTVWH